MGRVTTALHVVYRSHGGENRKARPDWYDKAVCLASFVRALGHLDRPADVLFLNDGDLPPERLALMRPVGEVRRVAAGSNRASYRLALRIAARRWSDRHDVVWFAEDDYLYAPDALVRLLDAAHLLPDADYLALHAAYALDERAPRSRPRARTAPRSSGVPSPVDLGAVRWYRALSTTSTFGVRGDVLAADVRLLRSVPLSGGAFDHATCLTYQGLRPYRWSDLAEDLLVWRSPVGEWPRRLFRGTTRLAVDARARRTVANRRRLYASDPEPVAHAENDLLAPGTDWAQVAREVREWAATRAAPATTG